MNNSQLYNQTQTQPAEAERRGRWARAEAMQALEPFESASQLIEQLRGDTPPSSPATPASIAWSIDEEVLPATATSPAHAWQSPQELDALSISSPPVREDSSSSSYARHMARYAPSLTPPPLLEPAVDDDFKLEDVGTDDDDDMVQVSRRDLRDILEALPQGDATITHVDAMTAIARVRRELAMLLSSH
jgi:hypothetical protein